MDGGRTLDQRRCGKTWKRPVGKFGESVHFTPVGENNAMRGGDLGVTCIGVLWRSRQGQRNLARLVVPEVEADQGVAPVIVMLAAPRTDRKDTSRREIL